MGPWGRGARKVARLQVWLGSQHLARGAGSAVGSGQVIEGEEGRDRSAAVDGTLPCWKGVRKVARYARGHLSISSVDGMSCTGAIRAVPAKQARCDRPRREGGQAEGRAGAGECR